MPKIKQINHNTYEYNCECGAVMRYETDEKPLKKIYKCFKCQEKFNFEEKDNE